MDAKEKKYGPEKTYESYVSQINEDWLFLKGQMIFGGILFLGLLAFLLWQIQ
ncbi:hypothetical protein [Salinimicrobium flavum]|uniref:Uncharacterized protein n=1 Tax=Salinimicrobium flavum TaxID=1737065 RepID=A0ABW5IY62_9FLAO